MAKIFYTIEEACARLGKSEADILALIKSVKLREFRDQDQLKLKVEDVTSLSDSGLDMGSKLKNLSDGSGSFELDLSDSMSPAIAQDPKGASPVGPTAPPAIEDDLVLDLGSMASGETPAAAEQSSAGDDAFTFELDLDESAASTPPAKSAAPVAAKIEIDDDAMTLELDLGDSQPAAPTPAKTAPKVAAAAITDDLSFEDDLGADLAQSAVAPAANKFDQTVEDARDESAMGFDSRVDSALGGSAGLDADTMSLDQPGSGSGLLDLTQESDDSQMGAALLESTFEGDDEAPKTQAESLVAPQVKAESMRRLLVAEVWALLFQRLRPRPWLEAKSTAAHGAVSPSDCLFRQSLDFPRRRPCWLLKHLAEHPILQSCSQAIGSCGLADTPAQSRSVVELVSLLAKPPSKRTFFNVDQIRNEPVAAHRCDCAAHCRRVRVVGQIWRANLVDSRRDTFSDLALFCRVFVIRRAGQSPMIRTFS